ncbi:hypothetical protein E2C01_038339 [Portunus trituberculatus]|uniref:Uncharacterized protein n=1 Tax=Portunus trituberculatus TaxID=210409 RepID=A0A5B7FBZ1_PORTR|nr:hypothetical protein [Portunus trituberculatus]
MAYRPAVAGALREGGRHRGTTPKLFIAWLRCQVAVRLGKPNNTPPQLPSPPHPARYMRPRPSTPQDSPAA